jgi:iron complex outermembrane receptor protein
MSRVTLLKVSSVLALSIAPIVHAAPAFAQDNAPAVEEGLTDIVVTAEKRETTVQKTAISLSVLSADTLKKNSVANLSDLSSVAPSVSFVTANAATIVSIRGVSSRDTTEIGDPAVSISVDGFNLQRAIGLNATMFDLERVEVLRGPQGTLLGRNATGGAINIITAKPGKDFAASLTGELGNYQMYNTSGMINLPINDGLRVRAAFQTQDRNGFRNNAPAKDGDDNHSKAARISIGFDPTSRWSGVITAEYAKLSGVGPVVQGIPVDRHTVANGPYLPGDIVLERPAGMNDKAFPLAPGHFTSSRSWNIRGTTSYDLDFADLTYVGGWRQLDFHRLSSLGGTFGTNRQNFAFNANEHLISWNHELRLASKSDGPLVWQVGGFYFKEKNRVHTLFVDFPGSPGFYGTRQVLQDYVYPDIQAEARAVFGQASYEIVEGLKVEAGARYSKDKKHRFGFNNVTNVPNYLATGCRANCVYTLTPQASRMNDSKTTFHAAINYQVTPSNLLYAKFDTGYKAGGFTDLNQYGPESIKAYEIGSKNRFLDNKLQVNLSAYWYDYSDQQVSQFLNTPAGIVAQIVVNAGSSRYKGVEADIIAQPTPEDQFNFYVGYSDAKYRDFLISAGAPTSLYGRIATFEGNYIPTSATTGNWQLAGRRPPQAPLWTFNAGYQHDFQLAGGKLTPRIQTHYESSYHLQVFNFDSDKQPGYFKSDFILTYAPDNGRWQVEGFVRNIENTRILAQATDPTSAVYFTYRYQYQAPRTYGGRLTVNF